MNMVVWLDLCFWVFFVGVIEVFFRCFIIEILVIGEVIDDSLGYEGDFLVD